MRYTLQTPLLCVAALLQCIAVCCSVLKYISECCIPSTHHSCVLQHCCNVLCCSVLQYVAYSSNAAPVCCSVVAMYCNVLHCVVVCCSVLQCISVCFIPFKCRFCVLQCRCSVLCIQSLVYPSNMALVCCGVVAVCCMCCSVFKYVSVCCIPSHRRSCVLQHCCSVLQYVSVYFSMLYNSKRPSYHSKRRSCVFSVVAVSFGVLQRFAVCW